MRPHARLFLVSVAAGVCLLGAGAFGAKLPDLYAYISYKSQIPAELRRGEVLEIEWLASNNGTMCIPEDPYCFERFGTACGPWDEACLLSRDSAPDAADILLGVVRFEGNLAPHGSHWVNMSLVIPSDCPAGDYRVIVYTDYLPNQPGGLVVETSETNNWEVHKTVLTIAGAGTLYVDDDGPGDPGPGDPCVSDPEEDGSAGHPFDTIEEAMVLCSDGDTVIVAEGKYVEDVNYGGMDIVLTGADPGDWGVVEATIISGDVMFRGTEGPACVLRGFKIEGTIAGFDALIDPVGENHTRAAISNCLLEDISTGCGNVIRGCDGTISNCIIAHTSYMCLRPWPVPAISGCHGVIRNCTFAGMHDGIEVLSGGACTIENCVIYDSSPIIVQDGAVADISYCAFNQGQSGVFGPGKVRLGPGIIDVDPVLVDPDGGDFHLRSQGGRWDADVGAWVPDDVTSPCIDAGDRSSALGPEPFPNGGIVNMGAYGGTSQASKSYFGGEACEVVVAGDINGDCVVDLRDFELMAFHWLEDHRR